MSLYTNDLYADDIKYIANLKLPWDKLRGKTVLIAGATGMIGSCFIDVLFEKDLGVKVIALGRNIARAQRRFNEFWDSPNFSFIQTDINDNIPDIGNVDFMVHAASNTHPVLYSTDPIGTITTNVMGTYNLLNYAKTHNARRFIFLSSVEIYGENRGDTDRFGEAYCGYIDCNTLRAGYPESKRLGEALCQAFIHQKGLDIVIARLARVYGPTMLKSDSKALSQFIKKGVLGEDIVLKSAGNQLYSYVYVIDAVAALLTILLEGKTGEAYNIADKASDRTLRDVAETIARLVGHNVVFEQPDPVEAAGYSKATKAVLDSSKLQNLGWKARYDLDAGLERTISILRECSFQEEV